MTIPPHSRLRRVTALLGALALLGLCGWLLRFPAAALQRAETAAGLIQPPAPMERQDALGRQLSFLVLGGLRSLTAELLCTDATDAWLSRDWPRSLQRWRQITALAPRRVNYWMRASRDLARNAVADTNTRTDLPRPEQARLADSYLAAGEQFLLDGIAENPQSPLLYLELGAFYENPARRPQFAKAAEAYARALELGAPQMYRRWVFYNLCRIRGREQEAWELGRQIYAVPNARTPSVRCLLFVLQNKLSLPQEQRISVEELFGSTAKARRDLSGFLHNDLRFPTTGVADFLELTRGN
ncbi:MAG: hypothetical protein Q4F30_01180 [Akkermansia sp.]|nr:hypothetical protein [Akkermansia sp.]